MRSLSLVDRVFFKDIYTSNSRNLCLYDVDNDGDNELIIGSWDSGPLLENGEANAANSEGSVHVLKYRKVWKASYHLGMTWIIALCADSHCYAFDACALAPESENISSKSKQKVNVHGSSKPDQTIKAEIDTLKMVHHQELAYNAKDVCIFNEGQPNRYMPNTGIWSY
ncbi:unnamed protein product [Schistosoma curassoni]|uniref:Integrin-alpha FG-GAP repeat-containing protein 2 n=1 Tax=Schistosoma curassoni TaxID=6186 RepID=A0A183K8T4_9TREM|nr:unnamed protein product [Schistosoma curassoni]